MENKPLISVIMNCFNSDSYLKEALESVIAQTYQNWEIIFWDNQSTDASAEIIQSYSDKRIKYFYATRHTLLGKARNLAVEKANGEWIAFLDCDDVWYENKLEIQLENTSNEVGMIYSRMEFLIETSGIKTNMAKNISKDIYPKRKKLPSDNIFDKLLFECFIPLPSVMIRKKLFKKVGGIDDILKVAEDYDIFLKIAKISKVKALDKVLCKYRVHEDNLSHANFEEIFEESISLIKKYLNYKIAQNALDYWSFLYKIYLYKNNKIFLIYYLLKFKNIKLLFNFFLKKLRD